MKHWWGNEYIELSAAKVLSEFMPTIWQDPRFADSPMQPEMPCAPKGYEGPCDLIPVCGDYYAKTFENETALQVPFFMVQVDQTVEDLDDQLGTDCGRMPVTSGLSIVYRTSLCQGETGINNQIVMMGERAKVGVRAAAWTLIRHLACKSREYAAVCGDPTGFGITEVKWLTLPYLDSFRVYAADGTQEVLVADAVAELEVKHEIPGS